MGYLSIFGRAFAVVSLTSANVCLVALHYRAAAFVTGGLLSYVWWHNAHTAATSKLRGADVVYAFGAACGTVAGMTFGVWIGSLL